MGGANTKNSNSQLHSAARPPAASLKSPLSKLPECAHPTHSRTFPSEAVPIGRERLSVSSDLSRGHPASGTRPSKQTATHKFLRNRAAMKSGCLIAIRFPPETNPLPERVVLLFCSSCVQDVREMGRPPNTRKRVRPPEGDRQALAGDVDSANDLHANRFRHLFGRRDQKMWCSWRPRSMSALSVRDNVSCGVRIRSCLRLEAAKPTYANLLGQIDMIYRHLAWLGLMSMGMTGSSPGGYRAACQFRPAFRRDSKARG